MWSFGHRGLGEVAPHDEPFVVLVGQHGADEADHGGVVGEDPDDATASAVLLFKRSSGWFDHMSPVRFGERGERKYAGLGRVPQRSGLGVAPSAKCWWSIRQSSR